ncbi:MAG: Trk family potassium uptake protein [Spirochaetales bacterium]|nr:MAG: Trk family potassium uptake protein [Spirochaetales bacterium]
MESCYHTTAMSYRISSDKLTIFSYFISLILAGSFLLVIPASWGGEKPLGYLDALFTATSAVCVTGLIVVDTAQFTHFGQFVIMLLIQFGGLGIVTFATLFVAMSRRRVSMLNRGIIQELYIEEVDANPRRIVKSILLTTLAVESLGFLSLSLRFRSLGVVEPVFSSIFLSVSAFCNAGFSVFSDSLERFEGDWAVNLTFVALIVTGGLGFVVLQDVGRVILGRKRRLTYHTKIVFSMTGILILVGMAAFYLLEYDGAYAELRLPDKFLAALFQAVTPRTAGFDTIPQASLGLPSIALIIVLMFTGGSPGSTAGGVKTTTVFMALLAAFRGPQADGSLTYRGGALSAGSVARTLSILLKAASIIGVSFVGLLVFEGAKPGADFGDILFESVSAFGTVGLSRGITADLTAWSKAIVIGTMFAGRVGLFAMAVMRPSDKIERYAEYPRENMMLG